MTGTKCILGTAPTVPSHDQHTHRLLTELEADSRASQRSLSRELGIALGLTNLLVRDLVHKGWVRVVRIKPNRVGYLLTSAGLAEKARMSRQALQNNVRFYAEARDRVAERFAQVSAQWPRAAGEAGASATDGKRIVFYGAGEVAEIGSICLHKTDLHLVGVVDSHAKLFFGMPVHTHDQLQPDGLAGTPYEKVVVMSFDEIEEIRARLSVQQIPADRIVWL